MPALNTPIFHPTKPLYWQFLNIQFKTTFNSSTRKMVAGVVVSTVLVIMLSWPLQTLFIAGPAKVSPSPVAAPSVLGQSTASQPVTPTPTPLSGPTPPVNGPIYRFSLTAQPALASFSGVLVADALVDALKLPLIVGRPYPITNLSFDVDGGEPQAASTGGQFNHEYYALVPAAGRLNRSYTSDLLSVSVVSVSPSLVPYLSHPKFCLIDADCRLRSSRCVLAAFNRFEPYTGPYTCLKTVTQSGQDLMGYDPVLGCPAHQEFSPPICSANNCQTEAKPVCNL